MEVSKVITEASCRIDYDNLCGGNDFAKLTDNFSQKGIQDFIWSIPNDIVRLYVKRAVTLEKKIKDNPTYEEFDKLFDQQLELNIQFKSVLYSLSTLKENNQKEKAEAVQAAEQILIDELSPILYGDKEKVKEYVTNMNKITDNTEKAQYTAQLVNANIISEASCKNALWAVLHKHNIYAPSYNNWTKHLNIEIGLAKLGSQKKKLPTNKVM